MSHTHPCDNGDTLHRAQGRVKPVFCIFVTNTSPVMLGCLLAFFFSPLKYLIKPPLDPSSCLAILFIKIWNMCLHKMPALVLPQCTNPDICKCPFHSCRMSWAARRAALWKSRAQTLSENPKIHKCNCLLSAQVSNNLWRTYIYFCPKYSRDSTSWINFYSGSSGNHLVLSRSSVRQFVQKWMGAFLLAPVSNLINVKRFTWI